MEIVESIFYILLFLVVVAVFLWLLEGIAKIVGSKVVWLTVIIVIPALLGVVVVIFNFENLSWFEIVVYPFIGPMAVLCAGLLVCATINPEVFLIPFIYVYEHFKKRKK